MIEGMIVCGEVYFRLITIHSTAKATEMLDEQFRGRS